MPRIGLTPRSGDTPRARALGQELRRAREAASLTTRQLAERLGHTANSKVVRWEQGHTPPSVADAASALQGSSNCVELAHAGQEILVRNSRNPRGPRLRFPREAFEVFAAAVNADH